MQILFSNITPDGYVACANMATIVADQYHYNEMVVTGESFYKQPPGQKLSYSNKDDSGPHVTISNETAVDDVVEKQSIDFAVQLAHATHANLLLKLNGTEIALSQSDIRKSFQQNNQTALQDASAGLARQYYKAKRGVKV